MQTKKLYQLVTQNLKRNRKNIVFSSIGIVVGISSFVFFIALGNGIKNVVATKIFPLDANRVQVVPRTAHFGSLGDKSNLNQQSIKRLKQLPGVKTVYPRMKLSILASSSVDGRDISPGAISMLNKIPGITPKMTASIRGIRMWLEIMGNGIDPRLVEKDVIVGEFKDPEPGQPIPVLLSRRMIEIYNSSFAQARSLPQVSQMLIPFLPPIPLTLNHSFISRKPRGPKFPTSMKVVGLSHHAMMGGITMPLETARKFNQQFAGQQAGDTYDAAIVEVISSDWLGPVQENISEMGYDIDITEKRMAESVGFAVIVVTLGFTLISLIIVGIAAINISHTFFMIIYERKREIGLMRALGSTKANIRSIILGEATFIGAIGGLLGILLGAASCFLGDFILVRFVPDFPFKPDSFFAYPLWLFTGAILFAILFCVLGAYFPARRAANMDPVTALTGR
jgi:ABC-type lipoprotein release transport system permease subunit